MLFPVKFFDDQRAVGTAKAERVGQGAPDIFGDTFIGSIVEIALLVRDFGKSSSVRVKVQTLW